MNIEEKLKESGKRLEALRKRDFMTYKEIGDLFTPSVRYQSVQKWIKEGVPTGRAQLLAEHFKVDERWLLLGAEDCAPNDLIVLVEETQSFNNNYKENQKLRKSIGRRLLTEEERCDISQEELAALTCFTIDEIEGYEYGLQSMPSEFLAKLPECFDIQYILTGKRAHPPAAPSEQCHIYNVSQKEIKAVSVLGVDASVKE